MKNDPGVEKKSSILPLHPALVERMFYKPKEWEALFRTDEPLRGGKPPQPDLGTSLAGFLEFLAPMFQAKLALDLGTGLGYSSHLLAKIVGPDGSVLSVEREPALARRARENLKLTGMDKRVAVIMGEAHEVMQELTGPYDIILLDVDKAQYLDLFDRIIDLLAVGGHLIVDDVGFLSQDFEPRLRPLSLHIARFVKVLLQDPNLDCIYIPLGDGLVLARKLGAGEEKQLSIFDSNKGASDADDPAADTKTSSKPRTEQLPGALSLDPRKIPRNLATSMGAIKPQKTDS